MRSSFLYFVWLASKTLSLRANHVDRTFSAEIIWIWDVIYTYPWWHLSDGIFNYAAPSQFLIKTDFEWQKLLTLFTPSETGSFATTSSMQPWRANKGPASSWAWLANLLAFLLDNRYCFQRPSYHQLRPNWQTNQKLTEASCCWRKCLVRQ